MILVAGVAGFIDSNFVHWLAQCGEPVVNFDALTYAGNQVSLQDDDPHFFLGSVGDFDRGSATCPVPARGGNFAADPRHLRTPEVKNMLGWRASTKLGGASPAKHICKEQKNEGRDTRRRPGDSH